MRILAISGSLRVGSSNSLLLQAAIDLAPKVREFRNLIASVDGILISSPEYAHGVPGALKNALDWLVSSTEFPGKRVVLIDCSGGFGFARSQLTETLKTMCADVPDAINLYAPAVRKAFDESGKITDASIAQKVQEALSLFTGHK